MNNKWAGFNSGRYEQKANRIRTLYERSSVGCGIINQDYCYDTGVRKTFASNLLDRLVMWNNLPCALDIKGVRAKLIRFWLLIAEPLACRSDGLMKHFAHTLTIKQFGASYEAK